MGGTRLPLGYTHFFRLIRLAIVPSHLTISPSNQTFQATSFAALMTHRTIFGFSSCCSFYVLAYCRSHALEAVRQRSNKVLVDPFPATTAPVPASMCVVLLPCLFRNRSGEPRSSPTIGKFTSGGFPQTASSSAHQLCESSRSRKPKPRSSLLPAYSLGLMRLVAFVGCSFEITSCGTPPSAM